MSEEWDFYLATIDDHPASICIDIGIHDQAPMRKYGELLRATIQLQDPQEDGQPGDDEYDELSDMEDAISAAATQQPAPAIYVGRATHAGIREFYFYVKDERKARKVISRALERFPNYEPDFDSQADPEWNCYLEFLYPTPEVMLTIRNRHMLEYLEEQGDDAQKSRIVTHWAYFSSAEGRDAFDAECRQRGFATEHAEMEQEGDEPPPYPFGIQVSREDTVQWDDINDIVLTLFELAVVHEGAYDGWETSVEADAETP